LEPLVEISLSRFGSTVARCASDAEVVNQKSVREEKKRNKRAAGLVALLGTGRSPAGVHITERFKLLTRILSLLTCCSFLSLAAIMSTPAPIAAAPSPLAFSAALQLLPTDPLHRACKTGQWKDALALMQTCGQTRQARTLYVNRRDANGSSPIFHCVSVPSIVRCINRMHFLR
jgi:hypothetical protein